MAEDKVMPPRVRPLRESWPIRTADEEMSANSSQLSAREEELGRRRHSRIGP